MLPVVRSRTRLIASGADVPLYTTLPRPVPGYAPLMAYLSRRTFCIHTMRVDPKYMPDANGPRRRPAAPLVYPTPPSPPHPTAQQPALHILPSLLSLFAFSSPSLLSFHLSLHFSFSFCGFYFRHDPPAFTHFAIAQSNE